MWTFYKLSLTNTKFSELLAKMDIDFLTAKVVHVLFHNSKGHDDYSQLDFVYQCNIPYASKWTIN